MLHDRNEVFVKTLRTDNDSQQIDCHRRDSPDPVAVKGGCGDKGGGGVMACVWARILNLVERVGGAA